MLILSVSHVALQSTVYSLLDKMVIDRLNEAAIELTSTVGPAKTGSPIIQKTLQIVRVIDDDDDDDDETFRTSPAARAGSQTKKNTTRSIKTSG